MEKLVLTTYRKIVKMGASLDQDVAKRSLLSCAPTVFFNHRTLSWTEVDIAKEVGWAEPRAFLDKLIRRLNASRENYIPPTPEEVALAKMSATTSTAADAAAPTTPTPAAEGDNTTATDATPTVAASAEPVTETASSAPPPSTIPPAIEPFMSLQRTARLFFETTPFSMSNLNKAFAAVKELSYACENFRDVSASDTTASTTDASASASRKPATRPFVTLPAELASMETPILKRAMTVAPAEDLQLMHGLSEDLRESLSMMAPDRRDVLRQAGKESGGEGDGNEEDDDSDVVVTVVAEMEDDAADLPIAAHAILDAAPRITPLSEGTTQSQSHTTATAASASADVTTTASVEEGQGEETASARPTVFSPSSSATSHALKPPPSVQLLIAHPQLTGFFQNVVMLVVRNADNEAIALSLNAPLKRDAATQLVIARDAICGFPGAHPIYEKHLCYHSILIGGPVQAGESPDDVAVLHQIPDVPGAIPLASNLFLHGDLDVIMRKLDAGEAAARDVVLIVGFAGWGRDQLQGEVRNGVWLVAQGSADDAATGDFVMDVARASGATLLVPPAGTAKAPEPKTQDAVDGETREAEVSRGVRRHVNFMATVRDGTLASWIWALKAMGEPYASLGRNQKRNARSKLDEYMK